MVRGGEICEVDLREDGKGRCCGETVGCPWKGDEDGDARMEICTCGWEKRGWGGVGAWIACACARGWNCVLVVQKEEGIAFSRRTIERCQIVQTGCLELGLRLMSQ